MPIVANGATMTDIVANGAAMLKVYANGALVYDDTQHITYSLTVAASGTTYGYASGSFGSLVPSTGFIPGSTKPNSDVIQLSTNGSISTIIIDPALIGDDTDSLFRVMEIPGKSITLLRSAMGGVEYLGKLVYFLNQPIFVLGDVGSSFDVTFRL